MAKRLEKSTLHYSIITEIGQEGIEAKLGSVSYCNIDIVTIFFDLFPLNYFLGYFLIFHLSFNHLWLVRM